MYLQNFIYVKNCIQASITFPTLFLPKVPSKLSCVDYERVSNILLYFPLNMTFWLHGQRLLVLIDTNQPVDSVYLDYEKTFDHIEHISWKTRKMQNNLLSGTKDFLFER